MNGTRSEAEASPLHGMKLRPLGRGVFIDGFKASNRLGELIVRLLIEKISTKSVHELSLFPLTDGLPF